MAWEVVPSLLELKDQLNKRFPKRDTKSDGTIGNVAHQGSSSSHNPDKTGNPEYRDGDSKDEVRARDIDKDLNDVDGVTMEIVVQLWVTLARAGILWWVRYIIYNGRIWHKSDGFKTRTYTGSNKHDQHVHITTDFNQKADEATGTNWYLTTLTKPKPPAPKPKPPTVKVIKKGDTGQAVVHIQDFFRRVFPAYRNEVSVQRGRVIVVDGNFGAQTEAWVKEFQQRTGLNRDGVVGPLTLTKFRKYGYQF
jgi:peptidoglycan hydrolase-like protein with peptidoglycan-binding domain